MSKQRLLILGLLTLGMALRAGCAELALRGLREPLPDSQLYAAYAQTIYHGRPYFVGDDGARRAPGYPMFLAMCWTLAGGESDRATLWGQSLLSTLGCWIVYRLALGWEGAALPAGSALLALALAVSDPYSIALASLALSETLFATLLLGAVGLAALLQDRVRVGVSLALGTTSGLAVLTRPSVLLLLPLAALLWMLLANLPTVARRNLALAGAGCLLALAPWWIRNAQVYGRFVPTTLNVGESLYDGLNPLATGGSDMRFAEDPQVRGLPETVRDRHWWDEARRYGLDHPGRVVELALVKFWRFWSPWPNADSMQRPMVVIATTLWTVPVLALALWGTWTYWRQRGLLLTCWLPAFYFCGLHMIFVSSVRYRSPVMPLLTILAGAAAACAFHGYCVHRKSVSSGSIERSS